MPMPQAQTTAPGSERAAPPSGALARPLKAIGAVIAEHPLLFVLCAAWLLAPIAYLTVHVLLHGGTLTGAAGYDPYDQLAYLAWIRDSSRHVLASNLWQLTPTPHDYLQPLYFASGLLVRLGLSIQLAYLLWSAVALFVLFCGFGVYVRQLLPGNRRLQGAALAVALFYESPVLALWKWQGHLSITQLFALLEPGNDANAALNLWGLAHAAIAAGMMGFCLAAVTRLRSDPSERTSAALRWSAGAGVAGALVSWLHPWQGVMLIAAVLVLPLVTRDARRWRELLGVVALTALPLIYGVVLARSDPSWRTFQHNTTLGTSPPAWALLVTLGPLVALSTLGLRRPRDDRDWLLVLWLASCVGVYLLVPEFPPHALVGVTLPLAVLSVRGWQRLRARFHQPGAARALVAAGGVALLLFTVPAAINHLHDAWTPFSNPDTQRLVGLDPAESRAMAYIASQPGAGGVIADPSLAMTVPGLTGHPAYAGHLMWRPANQLALATAFFAPGSSSLARRMILKRSGSQFVLADCQDPRDLGAELAPLVTVVRSFGCVRVYERVK